MIMSSVVPANAFVALGERRVEYILWHSPVRPLQRRRRCIDCGLISCRSGIGAVPHPPSNEIQSCKRDSGERCTSQESPLGTAEVKQGS